MINGHLGRYSQLSSAILIYPQLFSAILISNEEDTSYFYQREGEKATEV